jgi:hypothetical protein
VNRVNRDWVQEPSDLVLTISSHPDLNQHLAAVSDATTKAIAAIAAAGTPEHTLRRMKFEQIGFHPIEGHALNFIEQINQTFTYLVALRATAWLLNRHPDAGGFRLAPGANAALPLDIMSVVPDLVGAETFAAVHPKNNRKLAGDLQKLKMFPHRFRYAFFFAPGFPHGRVEHLEREEGIEVHCVEI